MKLDFYIETHESPYWKDKKLFEQTLRLLAEAGYDGVEFLPFNLNAIDTNYIKEKTSSYGLDIVCIASGFLNVYYGLSFSHPSERIRQLAVENFKECIKIASKLNAKFVSIGLIKGKLLPGQTYENAIKNFSECLKKCSQFANDYNIKLIVEPENRYESNIICTVQEALKILETLSFNNIGLLIDSYHMNIEESNIPNAIKASSNKLLHVHLADNNRLAPGKGFFNFKSFIKCLQKINYNSYLGIEINLLPNLEDAIKSSSQYIKKILNQL